MRLLHTTGCHSRSILTASELVALPVELPDIQREICAEHVAEIVAHQKNLHRLFGYYLFTGVLTFAKYSGILYCVDGQHRREAAIQLYQEDPLGDFEVAVEIITCRDMESVLEWFQIVNSNRPLPSFLLADASSESAAEVAALPTLLRELRDYLKKTYKDYLTKSQKPQRPNIHVDQFVEEVGRRYRVELLAAPSAVAWLEAENGAHHATLLKQAGHESVAGALKRVAEKGKGPPFYLGVFWLDSVKNGLSAPLRRRVWEEWYAAQPAEAKTARGEVACPCCASVLISAGAFHAGHKRSFKNGGVHALENLIPLCAGCNLSMGVMDYEAYRAMIRGVNGDAV